MYSALGIILCLSVNIQAQSQCPPTNPQWSLEDVAINGRFVKFPGDRTYNISSATVAQEYWDTPFTVHVFYDDLFKYRSPITTDLVSDLQAAIATWNSQGSKLQFVVHHINDVSNYISDPITDYDIDGRIVYSEWYNSSTNPMVNKVGFDNDFGAPHFPFIDKTFVGGEQTLETQTQNGGARGIRTESIRVDTASENGWADFAFDKAYQLATLKEIEEYIKINGHLPGIPSTKEVIEEGVDLAEMNKLLLMKIEELTIHIIELNNRIDELD